MEPPEMYLPVSFQPLEKNSFGYKTRLSINQLFAMYFYYSRFFLM